jgi:hypothetical protein
VVACQDHDNNQHWCPHKKEILENSQHIANR